MRFVCAMLWALAEVAAFVLFLIKVPGFWNSQETDESKNLRKLKYGIGIFVLIALICGWQTAGMVQSAFDIIKVFLVYAVLSLSVLTDVKERVIPNLFVVVLILGRLVLLIPEWIFRQQEFRSLMFQSLSGGLICLVVLLIVAIVSKGGFGMGDVKLLTAEGLMLGLYGAMNTLLYGLICCAVYSLFELASHKKKLKDKIPFAPFIFAGFVICILIGSY